MGTPRKTHQIMMQHINGRINSKNGTVVDHGEGFSPDTSESTSMRVDDLALDGCYITYTVGEKTGISGRRESTIH